MTFLFLCFDNLIIFYYTIFSPFKQCFLNKSSYFLYLLFAFPVV